MGDVETHNLENEINERKPICRPARKNHLTLLCGAPVRRVPDHRARWPRVA
jgi:hypothetical protein